jgi:hypothetical protein
VLATQVETARAKSITLAVPTWMGHRAGQHVDVRLTAEDGYQVERSYSIASPPEQEQRVTLTVERLDSDGSPGAGGSVVLVQQWIHDAAAFEAHPLEEQEKVIGRTKQTSTELDEEVRGAESHVSRTVIEVNGVEQHIFRRNTPFGTATSHGTMFIGFSSDQHRLARMLDIRRRLVVPITSSRLPPALRKFASESDE